jgi:hypothetical protein
MRGLFIVWFILSVAYVARRGNARFTFGRQLSDQEGDRTGFLNRAFNMCTRFAASASALRRGIGRLTMSSNGRCSAPFSLGSYARYKA